MAISLIFPLSAIYTRHLEAAACINGVQHVTNARRDSRRVHKTGLKL